MFSLRTAAAVVALAGLVTAGSLRSTVEAEQQQQPARPAPTASPAYLDLVESYCLDCHDRNQHEAGLSLEDVVGGRLSEHGEVWEKVVKKLRTRQMPPFGEARPAEAEYDTAVASLENALDRAAEAKPNPGRTATIRRLTRTEYQERDPRPARARRGRHVAAAGRRVELRLRQRDRRRSPAHAARALHLSGREDQPACGRQRGPIAGRRHGQDRARPHAGRTPRGAAHRHARRCGCAVHVPAGRGVRNTGQTETGPRREGRGSERGARSRRAPGSRARPGAHREAHSACGAQSDTQSDAHSDTASSPTRTSTSAFP